MPTILDGYPGLLLNHLYHKCSESSAGIIALKIVNWKDFPPYFKLTEEATEIDQDPRNEENDKRRKLLYKWIERNGSDATYYKLIEIFLEAENREMAEEVCKHIQGCLYS